MSIRRKLAAVALSGVVALAGAAGLLAAQSMAPSNAGLLPQAQAKAYTQVEDKQIDVGGWLPTVHMVSNGKTAFYTDYSAIGTVDVHKRNLATGKDKIVKVIPVKEREYWAVAGVYNGWVYLNHEKWTQGPSLKSRFESQAVYAVKTTGKSFKLVRKGYQIAAASGGKYAVVTDSQGINAKKMWVCKLAGAKAFKKVRTLKNVRGRMLYSLSHACPQYAGGKLIYASGSGKRIKLYRANADGSNPKLIGGPWTGVDMRVENITSKHCEIHGLIKPGAKQANSYLYTYKTKKLKKL